MRISDFAVSADPVDRLVAKGAPVRALVALELGGVEWLALHQDERFRLCYYDESGAVATQDVDAVGLVLRAQELGWTAMRDLEPGPNPWLFDQASYHNRRGVHWYASATDRTDEMLPLGFPEVALKAGLERQRRRDAASYRRWWRTAQQAAKQARQKERQMAKQTLDELSEDLLRCPPANGLGLQTKAQARRAARELINDMIAHLRGSR